jgi:hypothetical protein
MVYVVFRWNDNGSVIVEDKPSTLFVKNGQNV